MTRAAAAAEANATANPRSSSPSACSNAGTSLVDRATSESLQNGRGRRPARTAIVAAVQDSSTMFIAIS